MPEVGSVHVTLYCEIPPETREFIRSLERAQRQLKGIAQKLADDQDEAEKAEAKK